MLSVLHFLTCFRLVRCCLRASLATPWAHPSCVCASERWQTSGGCVCRYVVHSDGKAGGWLTAPITEWPLKCAHSSRHAFNAGIFPPFKRQTVTFCVCGLRVLSASSWFPAAHHHYGPPCLFNNKNRVYDPVFLARQKSPVPSVHWNIDVLSWNNRFLCVYKA